MLDKDFKRVLVDIKNEINQTQVMVMSDANIRLINLYFKIGKMIYVNSVWGDKFIESLEKELKIDFPNIKGFSVRNLKRMKRFYTEYKEYEKVPSTVAQLPWTHNVLLFEKIKDINERFWYINEATYNNWSKVVLEHQISLNLYERRVTLDKPNNFQKTLISPQSDLANDLQKDPYIFNLPFLREKFIERELENALVKRIKDVLLELGHGFSFVGSQYKIIVGNVEYFIDMLFYHLKLRCYVIVELKTVPFQPEHAGKLNFYLSAVDELLKSEHDNPSIGLILCKEKDRLTVDYTLRNINTPIGVSSYEITKILPKEVLSNLPTEEEINLHIDIED